MAKPGKRMREATEGVVRSQAISLDDAVELIKTRALTKFDQTVDVAINLGVDPRHADQMVRGFCVLPHGTGKSVRVAVFAKGEKADEAKSAGADLVGAEDLVAQIKDGKIEFESCIATPDMMRLLGPIGKLLGPRGLMPNPKVGTVTTDIKAAVEAAKGGAVQFRVEKAGIIHAGVGKVSFEKKSLIENVKAFIDEVKKAKPAGAKGNYMKRLSISSTMGPGLRIDLSTV